MLSYLFLAYWIQQLMTVNKAAVFNKQKNGPALRLLFIFLVIMTSSNGFHLCSGCFICNYSNPFAFLFSSFFFVVFLYSTVLILGDEETEAKRKYITC